MKTGVRSAALAALLLLAAASAAAGVSVTFSQPEKFSDVPFTPWERERLLKDLADHFSKVGEALPSGYDLKVEVLDIDLAGRPIPNFHGGGTEVRILRGGADWPHMHLRYSLEQGGTVIASGEDHLRDMAYLDRISRYTNEPLRYEKQMIDDWFKQKILPLASKQAG
jgi:hypothetical protein